MSFEKDHIGGESLGLAAEDLRAYQGLAVRVSHLGTVARATSTDINSGPAYVLVNEPNSGQAVTAWGTPNTAQAKSNIAISAGAYVTNDASAYWVVGSKGNAYGTARTTVVSGAFFAMRLI
jgi:hypothetical protein